MKNKIIANRLILLSCFFIFLLTAANYAAAGCCSSCGNCSAADASYAGYVGYGEACDVKSESEWVPGHWDKCGQWIPSYWQTPHPEYYTENSIPLNNKAVRQDREYDMRTADDREGDLQIN